VKEEIDAFEFVNGDPVSEVCQDLAGTVFDKDDPDLFRYTPPLHWNCKSYIRPILKGNLGNKTIEKLKPSSKKIEETIQFTECPFHGQHIGLDGASKQ
jgi:NAD+--asparagine ADP-ribosyltransferase